MISRAAKMQLQRLAAMLMNWVKETRRNYGVLAWTQSNTEATMPSTTFTVRVEPGVKKRIEKLAKSTGRTRSILAAEALSEYLDVNERQVGGVKRAMASLDRGEGISHQKVKNWVNSWGHNRERPAPKRSAK
jgi:RHH-type transcriptional regulator, rel operon repressor / antitoxin RelB